MDIKNFFKKRYNTWEELEIDIEQINSSKEKGDIFECFVYYYLVFFKQLYQIKEIHCPIVDKTTFPQEILNRIKLERKDYGVDGVYITQQNDVVAWQSKFRSGRLTPTYSELSTFWAESEFADYRMVISNAIYLPKVSKKKQGHLSVLYDQFNKLPPLFFEGLTKYYAESETVEIKYLTKGPRDYQEAILADIENGFKTHKKGKLIAACGIGKTLVSLWVSERLKCKQVVFFAPSLQLIRQTLEEWSIQSKENFRYLCICSDQTINNDIDTNNIEVDEIDIPVSTNIDEICTFLSVNSDNRTVVFCTYQSSFILHSALKKINYNSFELAIYDEAHRTAGIGQSSLFASSVSDEIIPADRKLFMTATERLFRPKLISALEELNKEIFSMDDTNFYGPVFHKLTFGEAIKKNIISDYRIVFSGVTTEEIAPLLKMNLIVKDDSIVGNEESIENVYKRVILEKTINELSLHKVISFHSKIKEAKLFASKLSLIEEPPRVKEFVSHINGSMSAQQRAQIIDEFEKSDLGVLTNVRCLTEGVDIPLIDGVFFADPKGSLIDIIQAVGRALRQPYGEMGKISYVIIPLLVENKTGGILAGQGFEALFNLIQALRDQDETLAEWIDSINLQAARGQLIGKSSTLGKLIINIPNKFNYEEFAENLVLKIAEVNGNPTGTTGLGSKLGKNERRASFTRVFKTLCDYTPEKLNESLIAPTFNKIHDLEKLYTGKELKVNNNNVSHCRRLGLIKQIETGSYIITKIGKIYKQKPELFLSIMKNQMMLYSYPTEFGSIFPYRLAFQYMKELKQVSFLQFLYGIYSVQFDDNSPNLERAIDISKDIKKEFPSIELTNEANKINVLDSLNVHHPVGFKFEDVWTDRTTTGNQFRYFNRHLELFSDIFIFENGKLRLNGNGGERIDRILLETSYLIENLDYGSSMWCAELENYK